MKRRDFFKTTAAATAAISLPAAAIAVTKAPDPVAGGTGVPIDAEVTRLRVGNWRTADLREANRLAREAGQVQPLPDPPDDESNFWAEAIRIGDSYFYREGETIVPVLEYEYHNVIRNPNMYYFSSALKLHIRVKRAREGLPIA